MKRRTFLKASLVTAGGLALGASAPGCESDGGGAGDLGSTGDVPGGDTPGGDADAGPEPDAPGPEPDPSLQWFPQSVASGDPRPESVVLWTRVVDAAAAGDLELTLEVATDEGFASLVSLDGGTSITLTAEAAHDGCVKARVTGLSPATWYWYRFTYLGSEGPVSRAGRTRTAPADDADAKVRFAFVSCQDYNSRYFNTYAHLVASGEEIDFIVHLGDYIYETTGNPEFQDTDGRRSSFSDLSGAIVFHPGEEDEYHAAASISNYRDLYKQYRADPDLQAIHERWPMIAVWDDHEFSNDCWGPNATYEDEKVPEVQVDRRKAANQVWWEFMPVDYPDDPGFVYDPSAAFPGDIRIHRDFAFGQHVHLVMTDYRTYRSDHLIAEDALPGAIAISAEQLVALGEDPVAGGPYVEDITTFAGGVYADALKRLAVDPERGGFRPEDVTGPLSASWINARLADLNEAGDPDVPADIDAQTLATLPIGVSFRDLGKFSYFSDVGSRVLFRKEPYDQYARSRWLESGGESEIVMGQAQREWFLQTMQASTRTWKLWGNPFCLQDTLVDMRGVETLPEDFRQLLSIIGEDWANQPNRRDEVLEAMAALDNVVALTGDIHAFFAATPFAKGDTSKRIVELVTSSVSSAVLQDELVRAASGDPALKEANAPALAFGIEKIFQNEAKPNPHMAFTRVAENGYAVVEVDGSSLHCWMHGIDKGHVSSRVPQAELDGLFTTYHFRVDPGAPDLYMELDGTWRRWDPDAADWA